MGDLRSRLPVAIRRACFFMANLLVAAACHRADLPSGAAFDGRAVTALGAQDGYLFVFSPFNCSLKASQIDAINLIAQRTRRSGVILTAGFASVDSLTAADAVAQLGIHMRFVPLTNTSLATYVGGGGMQLPLVIAIRGGRVIGLLAGPDAERLDGWIAWLEQGALEQS